jgi:RNA polymerase sigma factor (sigma-70 family)
METIDTGFLRRLKNREEDAWFELWEVFGPALERMVDRFARRCFTPETVRDVSQETLLRLSREIHRYDPARGAKFSTWLFAIAGHVVAGEFAHRTAKKRGEGLRPGVLDPAAAATGDPEPGEEYERAVFRAKVWRALRLAEGRLEFLPFEVYKARILRGMEGKAIAVAMGISEPTVSRYLRKAREVVRDTIAQVVAEYSFTPEEREEVARQRLDRDDDLFDAALAEVWAAEEESRRGHDTLSRIVRAMGPGGGRP